MCTNLLRITSNDISELYSQFRVVARVDRHGLRSRFSLDLATQALDGERWFCSKQHPGDKTLQEFEHNPPERPVLSSMCGPLIKCQGLNYSKVSLEAVQARLGEGMAHFKCSMELRHMQAQFWRLFAFEHPIGVRPWVAEVAR